MRKHYQFLQENRCFLIFFAVFFLSLLLIVLLTDKARLHLSINAMHTPWLDVAMKHATYMGDGLTIGIISLVLLFYKYRAAFLVAACGILVAIFSALFKRVVFGPVLRPAAWFKDPSVLHVVEGVQLHSQYSFPSGHTTTAFALFLALSCLTSSKRLKVVYFFLAAVVAYSRVYLSQHFVEDVTAGSLIGVLLVWPTAWWVMNIRRQWLDRRLGTNIKLKALM